MDDLIELIIKSLKNEIYLVYIAPIFLFLFGRVRELFKFIFKWILDSLRQAQSKTKRAIIYWLWSELEPEIMCLLQPTFDRITASQDHTQTLLEGKIEDDKVGNSQIKEMLLKLIEKSNNRRATDDH